MNIKIFASLIYILIFFTFSLFLLNSLYMKIKKLIFLNKLANFLAFNFFEFSLSLILFFNKLSKNYNLDLKKNFFFYYQDLLFLTFFSKNYLKNILNRKNSLYYSLVLFQLLE